MTMNEFNECAKAICWLINNKNGEVKTRANWLKHYMEDTSNKWENIDELVKELQIAKYKI